MTFAKLSQATALSQRRYHRTQNTFNRISNSLMTIEIHDQGSQQKVHIIFLRQFFFSGNRIFVGILFVNNDSTQSQSFLAFIG